VVTVQEAGGPADPRSVGRQLENRDNDVSRVAEVAHSRLEAGIDEFFVAAEAAISCTCMCST
jgi:hypothetical protein